MEDETDLGIDDVAAIARGLVEWEEELGGDGFPDVEPPARVAAPPVEVPRADPPPAPAPAGSAPAAAAAPSGDRRARLEQLATDAAACTRCSLHAGRTRSVFARGNPESEIVFVGEGPGYNEDQQGLPFVGPAGQLLDKMIAAMGYGRDDVYICNVVKCRPPENRTPLPNEAAACAPFLEAQIHAIAPKVIVALGRCAAENLGLTEPGAKGWRGVWREWQGIPAIATYHPAFLLRSPEYKRPVWEDLQKVMTRLGKTPPRK